MVKYQRNARTKNYLFKAERSLATTKGLPRQLWYQHTDQAMGFYNGYGVKSLPQVRVGIEQGSYEEAQKGAEAVLQALEANNQFISGVLSLLRKSS